MGRLVCKPEPVIMALSGFLADTQGKASRTETDRAWMGKLAVKDQGIKRIGYCMYSGTRLHNCIHTTRMHLCHDPDMHMLLVASRYKITIHGVNIKRFTCTSLHVHVYNSYIACHVGLNGVKNVGGNIE